MLRRSSILSVCFLLFLALFALTADGQTMRIYHIGIPEKLEDDSPNPEYKTNGTVEGNDYYFDSLETLKNNPAQYYFIQVDGPEIEIILYSDQQIPNDPSDTFYSISIASDILETKTVRIKSADETPKRIISAGNSPNTDFLHLESNTSTHQKVNLIIDPNISITAGSTTEENRYATSIVGGDFTAEGVIYQDGGPIVVTNAGNLRSEVNLNGAYFTRNTANPTSNGAILSLTNVTSADLRNTNFIGNDADWQVYVFNDSSSNTTIQLGGTESVLGSIDDTGGGIFLGGSNGSYTVNVSGSGNFQQNRTIETDNRNYSLTVNKTDSGTWFIADEITNKFNVQGSATMNISAGTLQMGNNSKIELHGGNTTNLTLNDNSSLNMGDEAVFEVRGTSASLNLSNNSTLNTGKNSTIDIQGTNSTAFNLTNSTLNLGDSTNLNIQGTGNTNLTWNNSTVKTGNNSILDIKGSSISFTMTGGTLEMGENVQYQSITNGTNTVTLPNSVKVEMERGSKFTLTNLSKASNGNVNLYARTTLGGDNEIQTETLSISNTTFDIDAEILKDAYERSVPILTLNVSSINAGNTVFDIHGIHSNINHEIVQNIGTATFTENNYIALLDGVAIQNNSRAKVTIKSENSGKSLFLNVDIANKILRWNGNASAIWDTDNSNQNWYYEDELSPTDRYKPTDFIFNDAVIFDDSDNKDYTIRLDNDIYLSQQTGFLTNRETGQQNLVTEYGMRISGAKNRTFEEGSISDDFNPSPAESFKDQKTHVARLTFDGTGTIRINNKNANKFHDGLLIGNNVSPIQLSVARPDSLGSGEFAGEITDVQIIEIDANGRLVLDQENNPVYTTDYYTVQHEGYGIMFVDNGANIQIDNANKTTEDIFDQRIFVQQNSTGTLNIKTAERETVVTASGFYYENKNNFETKIARGGVIVVEKDASFTMTGKFHFKDNNNFETETNFDGGVLWADTGANVVMNGNSYSNNAANKNGGAIYFSGGTNAKNLVAKLNVSNSGFNANKAESGGAIYVNDNASLAIQYSSFDSNEAKFSGGAIDAQGNGITINGQESIFKNNIIGNGVAAVTGKSYQGGAIYLNDNGTLNMTSSVFRDNRVIPSSTESKGGAIYTGTGAKINLSNAVLERNSAYGNGGAIYSVSGNGNTSTGTLTINGTQFIENISETANGGAIFTGDTIIQGEDATFSQNSAGINGGALYVNHVNKDASVINIKDSQFDWNVAYNDGGAIYLNATGQENAPLVLDVSGTLFFGNMAQFDGGVIYANSYTTVNAKSTTNGTRRTFFGFSDDLGNYSGNLTYRNGGTIYIDGEVNNKATSQLNVDGADFRHNFAGLNGGAVYLHYADAEIANAEFFYNAASGFGGGIYYENENGKELTLKNVQMTYEMATSGGAVYAVNPTILNISDSVFSENTVTQDGGAVYFRSDNSQLNMTGTSITGTKFSYNIAAGNGGAVRLQNNSSVKTNGANFSFNEANNGGAIGIGNLAKLDIINTTFSNNTATQNGGAVWINDSRTQQSNSSNFEMNILNIDSVIFSNNEAVNGGAVYAKNATITSKSKGVTFSNNIADQNGGALYAENSDLFLEGATFTGNEAKQGGALYFLTTNNQNREITLKTPVGAANYFTENKSGSNANSIYFDVQGSAVTNISLNVETDGILYMNDPISVNNTKQNSTLNLDLDIVKTGNGRWLLGGSNDFSHTKVGTTVDIKNGTFELPNGSELLLTNADESDYFQLASGATLATSGTVNSSVFSNLKTTTLNFAAGSKMKLDGNLALKIENDYEIASILSGNGRLTKQDDKELKFTGATNNYNGNVAIEKGSFEILKSGVEGSGNFVTKSGSFVMNHDTSLLLHADLNQPSLVAKSVSIDRVHLSIDGISSNDNQKEFILIHTTDGILGNFKTVNGETETFTSDVDYLTFNLGFLNNRKDYGGTIGLRWYSKDDDIKASGLFTIEEGKYFNVGVELHDNKTNLDSDWSGTALDKYGLGTLELSATNTYSGKTIIHAGELLLTNKQGTGLGNAGVEVQKNTRLGLNFDGVYNKTVTGLGQVVQYGGTVELAGNNKHSGGTILKGGVTEFTGDNQFGTGTITFDGGTLRNKAETSLKRNIVIADGKTAQFDTPIFSNNFNSSLTFNGTISGNGGLEKTGNGMLTLTGKNTFKGTSYIRNGWLNIDGSVQSDVRVQPFAAVSGSGKIGGDLFVTRDGYFDWYYSPSQSASQPLNVDGSVYLAEGAVFRPRTDSTNFTNQIVDWTVLTYNKTLGGQFLSIDNTYNAFYDFELDYSVPGEIRVNGELLSHPRAMGDIITTGLSIANRKLYRKVFVELLRETMYRKTVTQNINGSVRGQAAQSARSVWFTPTARANNFASTFVGGIYDFEAYGMQTGSTFWSNNNSSLGLMIGYERGSLSNRLDWIRSHDYQIGLYFGHIFRSGSEFRSFIGGGFQTFTASRNDMVETYMTKYDGSSFEINAEWGKLFAVQNGTLFRPYFAVDIEYSGQTAAQEDEIGNAFRHYGRADLSQFFVRFGADVEKRGQFIDINGGASYTGLLFGQTRAHAPIFYPTRDAGATSYGARLGRSSVTLKTGLNWHLNRQRMNTIFLDYFADIYLDRAGGTVQHSGNLGILVRF
ncbi:MAG: autotransporter-associated beta strand repeat-containing protein [Planctomycetaceae bacterium]|jgi:autotransporter-associated beta strand protein/predicted outer membrane repeat protein|nr:autotransporter-associated beta strand repeat-containing protein [Planctomycetaceae bacterium]